MHPPALVRGGRCYPARITHAVGLQHVWGASIVAGLQHDSADEVGKEWGLDRLGMAWVCLLADEVRGEAG